MVDGANRMVADHRDRLGRVGIWGIMAAPISSAGMIAARIEAAGYGSLWTGEVAGGKDVFAQAALSLAATSRLIFGTGIANLWARPPVSMLGAVEMIGQAWPGRLVNGIGVSHSLFVETVGEHYAKPLTKMREYLAEMDVAASRNLGFGGLTVEEAEAGRAPRVLAALGPRMLELARDQADGAHPYFVPPEHATIARNILGPDKLLVPELAVVLNTDPAEARRIARKHMTLYLTLPNYTKNLEAMGYGDDLAGGGSDRLVDAIVAWGDEQAITRRVQTIIDNGADHVVLQPLADDIESMLTQAERLAPAVTAS